MLIYIFEQWDFLASRQGFVLSYIYMLIYSNIQSASKDNWRGLFEYKIWSILYKSMGMLDVSE